MSALAKPTSGLSPADFDVEYLAGQAPDLVGCPADFYAVHGLVRGLNPTPWFLTDWYAWQNPDWVSHPSPYDHYIDKGRFEGRDPSPFVDISRYRQITGAEPGCIYGLIRKGCRSAAIGVYDRPSDLARCQSAFRNAIELVAHRMPQLANPRKALVVLQAGRGLPKTPWQDGQAREWDLLVNYYDALGFRADLGEYVLFQKGTKFTAMWNMWRHFSQVLTRYEHVLFLDDDVETTTDDLNALFRMCRQHNLGLAQMSLCDRSFCNWDALFSQSGQVRPRPVSAVEIMMPVFSRSALMALSSTFSRSVSGFGLDMAWGKLAADAGEKIAVVDGITATHARPVDQSGGAYYSYLRRNLINPKSELWVLLQDYDADRNVLSE